MRKSKEETARTRRRIVAAAIVEFRRGGIANTSVADVMLAAGLTHGGFYRHFESKHALVEESIKYALDSLTADIEKSTAGRLGRAGVVAAVEGYMSAEHGPNDSACLFISLGSELARESRSVRDAATVGLWRAASAIGRSLPGVRWGTATKEALVILSTMIGALTMARFVSDTDLAEMIVSEAKKSLFARRRSGVA